MTEKGMREGITKDDILKLTKEEKAQIQAQREFEEIAPNSFAWKVAVSNDPLIRKVKNSQRDIEKTLLECKKIRSGILRKKEEVKSKHIISELKDGILMTEDELKSQIRNEEYFIEGNIFNIPIMLGEIRNIVGKHNIIREVIINDAEYEKYTEKIVEEVSKLGYDLFDL